MLGTPTLSIEIIVATFLIVPFWISYSKMCGSVHPPLSVRPAYWLMEVTPQNLYVLM